MACLSVDTNKHLLHALFSIQRCSRNRKKKWYKWSAVRSFQKEVWNERGSEQGLKEKEEYAEEGERKDEQFRGKQLKDGSWRGSGWRKGLWGDNKDGAWRRVVVVRDLTFQFSAGFLTCAIHVVHLLPVFSLIQTAWTLKMKTLWAASGVTQKFCAFDRIVLFKLYWLKYHFNCFCRLCCKTESCRRQTGRCEKEILYPACSKHYLYMINAYSKWLARRLYTEQQWYN